MRPRSTSAEPAAIASAIAGRALRRERELGPDVFLDKYRFETDPKLLQPVAAAVVGLGLDEPPAPDRLAGRELGAIPLVTAMAIEIGLPFVIVRRTRPVGPRASQLEGLYAPGEQLLLVEDVLTDGASALAAIDVLRAAELRVEVAVCVVDCEEGAAEALQEVGVRLLSLLRRVDVQNERR
jgi:orotate phosphoribosyltransferase